jgi:hypothetical protein
MSGSEFDSLPRGLPKQSTAQGWEDIGRVVTENSTAQTLCGITYFPKWATAPFTLITDKAKKAKLVLPGGLTKQLIRTIKASVKSAAIPSTCDWLVNQGYASDHDHARELVEASYC